MSKRKTMYKIELCTELQVGQRIAVVEKYGADHTTIRIGYVDSYSASKEQIYVDYRWRNDRGVPLWYNAGGLVVKGTGIWYFLTKTKSKFTSLT